MARFLYKAKNSKGEVVTGTINAQNEIEAERVLVKHNLVATDIIPERQKSLLSFFVGKVSVRDRAVFSRQLATMLSAGLSLTKAISILAKQANNEHQRQVFIEVYKDLEQGFSFSSALAKHPEVFDRVYISVVNSGETTGKLDVVLNELADQLENDSNFVSKVKSSLYYPAFIIIVLFGAGIFMMAFVIPKLKTMFSQAGQDLPVITRILLSVSDFVAAYWWLVILLVIGFGVFIKLWAETDSGSRTLNSFQLKIPVLNKLFQGMYMYRFTRIMSMLLGAGVPLLDALRIGGAVIDNFVYEESIREIAMQVERGVPLSTQLIKDTNFPLLVGQMAAVGEETGKLDVVLSKVAEYYERTTDEFTKVISSLVEPAVLIIVGIAVAFVVFAIYLPIYQINSSVGG